MPYFCHVECVWFIYIIPVYKLWFYIHRNNLVAWTPLGNLYE